MSAPAGILYLLLLAMMYETPIVSTHKYSMLIIKLLAPAIAVFSLIAIIVFGASGALSEFCKASCSDCTVY